MSYAVPTISRSVDQQPNDQYRSRKARGAFTESSAQDGASRAFEAKKQVAKPSLNASSGTNAALAAAIKAGVGAPTQEDVRREGRQLLRVGNAEQSAPVIRAVSRESTSGIHLDPALSLGSGKTSGDERRASPSHIAATLAASRATPSPRRDDSKSVRSTSRTGQRAQPSVLKDESHIPPTNKLVELFEGKQKPLPNDTEGSSLSPRASQAIVSPIPTRPMVPFFASEPQSNPTLSPSTSRALKQENTLMRDQASHIAQEQKDTGSSRQAKGPATEIASRTIAPPRPPPRRNPTRTDSGPANVSNALAVGEEDQSVISDSSSNSSYASARDQLSRSSTMQMNKTSIRADPPTRAELQKLRDTTPPPRKPSLPNRDARGSTSTLPLVRTTAPRLKPQLTADSLANAIVASSLASSRASSPVKKGLVHPPPPRRQSKTQAFSLLIPSPPSTTSRASSPAKGMRHTMRPHKSISDEEGHGLLQAKEKSRGKGKKHLVRKHPNKYAEGARRRWRDSVTETERKRYEGVWAANRGILISPQDAAPDEVHGFVVRDIWQRSGLGRAVLEQIWDLVCRPETAEGEERRRLRRDEFVVGMWLVDQCLKGRKLPVEVGDSVWASVKRLTSGMKVR